jgi:hypothetical protein
MKNYLFLFLIGGSMMLFSCGNKDKAESPKNDSTSATEEATSCGKCGTDECTCDHHKKETMSCEKCGNAECTCEGHQKEEGKVCDKCGMENCSMDHGASEDHHDHEGHEGHEH